eukprot:3317863-Pyramimonas_sp.AAC.1
MEFSSNEANAPAYGTGGLTRGTFHVTSHLTIHMGVYHAIPTLCVEYAAALETPDLVVIHEQVQSYGGLTAIAVTD